MKLVYVDDSGDETFTVLCALAIPEHRWNSYLKGWLTFRRQLFRDHGVPATYELHSQDWLSRQPLPLDGVDQADQPPILKHAKDARMQRGLRYERALKIISTFADAQLFTAYSPDTNKYDLYGELIRWVDDTLRVDDEFGLVVLDGLDQGMHYRARHRSLPIKSRRILEDPMECPSHGSQLIQMADLCAHAAFRHARASPNDSVQIRNAYPELLAPILAPLPDGGYGLMLGWK